MGAIFFLVYNSLNYNNNFLSSGKILESFNKSKNRGTDYTDFIIENGTDITGNSQGLTKDEIHKYKLYKYIYGYHRKFLNDSTHNGNQPFSYIKSNINTTTRRYATDINNTFTTNLICNGEIYNYNTLLSKYNIQQHQLQSTSDVEIILPLYNILGNIIDVINELDGDFSFILSENIKDIHLSKIKGYVVRDIFGFKPLYSIINNKEEIYMFVSELKSIPEFINYDKNFEIKEFPIGSYYDFSDKTFYKYYNWDVYKTLDICDKKNTTPQEMDSLYINLHELVVKSVQLKMQNISNNTNVGVLLSGGFDSSLLLSVMIDCIMNNTSDLTLKQLKIFTIGDVNDSSPSDVKYAMDLVSYLESKYNIILEHHIINISGEDLKSSHIVDLSELIYIIETYDLDTVRDAYPYYYLFKYIKDYKIDVSILFTGDGIDEICCGYSEFEELSDELYQIKNVEMIENIHKYDILRIEKLSSYFGLECRHPFLNKNFVEFYLTIHPKLKRNQVYMNENNNPLYIEKYLLRKTISILLPTSLPYNILWRSLKWSSQCIINFESQLVEMYGEREQQVYKEVFIKFFKKDTIIDLWVDYWKILF